MPGIVSARALLNCISKHAITSSCAPLNIRILNPGALEVIAKLHSPHSWYRDRAGVLAQLLINAPLTMHGLILGDVGHDEGAAEPRVAAHLRQIHTQIEILHLRRGGVVLRQTQREAAIDMIGPAPSRCDTE